MSNIKEIEERKRDAHLRTLAKEIKDDLRRAGLKEFAIDDLHVENIFPRTSTVASQIWKMTERNGQKNDFAVKMIHPEIEADFRKVKPRGREKLTTQKQAERSEREFAVFKESAKKFIFSYKREIRIWSHVKHINVAELSGFMDSFKSSIFPALFTQWCDDNLRELVEREIQPSNYERLKLLNDALGGLEYLHQNRIAHRDVKGANILVRMESNLSNESTKISRMACLTDFGFCKDIAQYVNQDISTTMQQSAQWMPPEYAEKGFHEARTTGDMWSFGCTFLEILRGNDPWHPVKDPQVAFKKMEWPAIDPNLPISAEHWRFIYECLRYNSPTPTGRITAKEAQVRMTELMDSENSL